MGSRPFIGVCVSIVGIVECRLEIYDVLITVPYGYHIQSMLDSLLCY